MSRHDAGRPGEARGRLERIATGRNALIAAAAAAAFALGFRPVLRALAVKPIELEWWPRKSGWELLTTISCLDRWERTNHLWALAIDFAFPFFYGLGIALATVYLLRRLGAGPGPRRIAYAAVAAAAFDLAENACIVALLLGSTSNAVAWAVIVLSFAKWVLVIPALVLVILLAVAAAVLGIARAVRGAGAPAVR